MIKKPMNTAVDYEAALARLHGEFGTRTQVQLAEALGVRQSSISDSKRRKSIPSDWLLKAMLAQNANPEWILTGQGPRYRVPSDEFGVPVDLASIEARIREQISEPVSTSELIEELQSRIPGMTMIIGKGLGGDVDLDTPVRKLVDGGKAVKNATQ